MPVLQGSGPTDPGGGEYEGTEWIGYDFGVIFDFNMFFGTLTWLTQKYVRIQPERQHARNGVNIRMKERTEEISIPFILLDVSFDELNNEKPRR